jgi:hypothetical protein
MSELIESLADDFEDLGYRREDAEKLACHARSLMEIGDISKSQVVAGIKAMMQIGRSDALDDLTEI